MHYLQVHSTDCEAGEKSNPSFYLASADLDQYWTEIVQPDEREWTNEWLQPRGRKRCHRWRIGCGSRHFTHHAGLYDLLNECSKFGDFETLAYFVGDCFPVGVAESAVVPVCKKKRDYVLPRKDRWKLSFGWDEGCGPDSSAHPEHSSLV